MGIVREPDNVDFFVDPRPLTKVEEDAISDYIKKDKEKRAKEQINKKKHLIKDARPKRKKVNS